MESLDITKYNIDKIGALFPNVITETMDADGTLKKAINFDKLRQELTGDIIDNNEESYDFTWVGKNQAIVDANTPIRKTLRPVVENETQPAGSDSTGKPYCSTGSKNFDTTENLYIEGDNLDVLKLLQESYLNGIKMIYIDPPYNTGKDFVYKDNFKQDKEEWDADAGIYDEDGNKRFVQNTETNGRFHSDWCSMIYARLKLAKNLLTDDGIIFISIDDNEVENLKKICNEIFGRSNFIGDIIRKTKSMTGDQGNGFNIQHENTLVISKNKSNVFLKGDEKEFNNYSNPDNDINGDWCSGDPSAKSGGNSTYFPIINPYTNHEDFPPKGRYWAFSKQSFDTYVLSGKIKFKNEHKDNERGFIFKRYKKELTSSFNAVNSLFIENSYMNQSATLEMKDIFESPYFSYPKPVKFLYKLIKFTTNNNDIILDFFSGSATTAHAVMQLNAEDGGNRKFICVQLPEVTDVKSEANKAGFETICEIGKERIRRAGEKIKTEVEENNAQLKIGGEPKKVPDIGFRVLKVDDTNMKDVYYGANEVTQTMLGEMVSNIKDDRTGLDLLYGVLLDWGLPLSCSCKTLSIDGMTVYNYDEGSLVACFEQKITETAIREIAKMQPIRVVFRDNSFANSADKINVAEIFKLNAPNTSVRVI